MEKTAKITRTVFKNEYIGQYGTIYYHEIELDNGDKGQIGCKEKEPAKINPGQSITYTLEQTQKGFKIKPVNPQIAQNTAFKPSGGAGNKYQPADPSIQMISFAMAYTKDLIVGDKLSIDQLEKGFERVYNLMKSKLDKIKE